MAKRAAAPRSIVCLRRALAAQSVTLLLGCGGRISTDRAEPDPRPPAATGEGTRDPGAVGDAGAPYARLKGAERAQQQKGHSFCDVRTGTIGAILGGGGCTVTEDSAGTRETCSSAADLTTAYVLDLQRVKLEGTFHAASLDTVERYVEFRLVDLVDAYSCASIDGLVIVGLTEPSRLSARPVGDGSVSSSVGSSFNHVTCSMSLDVEAQIDALELFGFRPATGILFGPAYGAPSAAGHFALDAAVPDTCTADAVLVTAGFSVSKVVLLEAGWAR